MIETLIMPTRNGVHQFKSATVHPVGTKCTIGGDIPAHVVAIRLNGVGVDYLVAWWDGKTQHDVFLDTFEIKFEAEANMQIGFHNGSNQ